MSEVKYPCLFDNIKECPVRTVNGWLSLRGAYALLLEACKICPIHAKMMEGKLTKGKSFDEKAFDKESFE